MLVLTALCGLAPMAHAQAAATAPDSIVVVPLATPDTAAAAARDTSRSFWKKPTGVMLRSLVLPGWGQATNHQWIKAGVVFAAETALLAGIIADGQRAEDHPEGSIERNQAIDDRQAKTWWLGGVIFLSMVDAYVSAHLRDFDIEAEPAPEQAGAPGVRLRVAYAFP